MTEEQIRRLVRESAREAAREAVRETLHKSQVHWPDGRHNTMPSLAVDVTPYPIVWNDRERQTLFAGFVLATAKAMGIDLRWGGDWDGDTEVRDNRFDDLVHFEIVE